MSGTIQVSQLYWQYILLPNQGTVPDRYSYTYGNNETGYLIQDCPRKSETSVQSNLFCLLGAFGTVREKQNMNSIYLKMNKAMSH